MTDALLPGDGTPARTGLRLAQRSAAGAGEDRPRIASWWGGIPARTGLRPRNSPYE